MFGRVYCTVLAAPRSLISVYFVWWTMITTVYDRIDAAATINFSTQFGAAAIRERRLFRSAWVQAEQ